MMLKEKKDTDKYIFSGSIYKDFKTRQNLFILLEIMIVVTFGIKGLKNEPKAEGGS